MKQRLSNVLKSNKMCKSVENFQKNKIGKRPQTVFKKSLLPELQSFEPCPVISMTSLKQSGTTKTKNTSLIKKNLTQMSY